MKRFLHAFPLVAMCLACNTAPLSNPASGLRIPKPGQFLGPDGSLEDSAEMLAGEWEFRDAARPTPFCLTIQGGLITRILDGPSSMPCSEEDETLHPIARAEKRGNAVSLVWTQTVMGLPITHYATGLAETIDRIVGTHRAVITLPEGEAAFGEPSGFTMIRR